MRHVPSSYCICKSLIMHCALELSRSWQMFWLESWPLRLPSAMPGRRHHPLTDPLCQRCMNQHLSREHVHEIVPCETVDTRSNLRCVLREGSKDYWTVLWRLLSSKTSILSHQTQSNLSPLHPLFSQCLWWGGRVGVWFQDSRGRHTCFMWRQSLLRHTS